MLPFFNAAFFLKLNSVEYVKAVLNLAFKSKLQFLSLPLQMEVVQQKFNIPDSFLVFILLF